MQPLDLQTICDQCHKPRAHGNHTKCSKLRQAQSAERRARELKMATSEKIDRLLRLDEVLHATGLGRNTVYRRIREGTFPKQVRIGPNSVAWRQSAVTEWMSALTPSNYQSVH